jgi:small subunit ribosomal protein S27e
MEHDLLNLPYNLELNTHKLKRTVPTPNSYFLRLKCPACETVSIVFSNSQSDALCTGCNKRLARSTGGKIRLEERVEYMVLGRNKKD